MSKEKITFNDRDDLVKKLVVKKSEANHENAVKGLQNALKRLKRGDKHAVKEIIKLRKKMLNAAAEVYMELEEESLFSTVVAEIEVVDSIED